MVPWYVGCRTLIMSIRCATAAWRGSRGGARSRRRRSGGRRTFSVWCTGTSADQWRRRRRGNCYFLLLVDDLSRYMWLCLLASKDQAPAAIRRFKAAAEVESGRKLKVLRTDRGWEFTSVEFGAYCAEEGVQRQLTPPYSPQQNGVVERRNQTVVGTARSMLKAKGLPGTFWGEAVTTAVFILNRSPTRSLDGKTPYEAHGDRPAVSFLRTFGCIAHVRNTKPYLKKLEDRSTPMIFVGYEAGSKAYRVYNPVDGRVLVTRDVVFDEVAQWDWGAEAGGEDSGGNGEFTVVFPANVESVVGGEPAGRSPAAMNSPPSATTRSTDAVPTTPSSPMVTAHTPPSPAPTLNVTHVSPEPIEFATPPSNFHDDLDADHDDDVPVRFRRLDELLGPGTLPGLAPRVSGDGELLFTTAEEPTSFKEAEKHQCWQRAMEEEMKSIEENKTWSLIELPAGHKPIGLKWVFKVKRDEHGAIVKHKARLVAKGYVQRPGIDFDEVFAPVARLESVRLLLAVAAQEGWEVHHMDVKSAFLNGDLAEEVYVAQPAGFVAGGAEHKVLKLRKALYGLRQAPRAWNAKLDNILLSLGFQKSTAEHGVYVRGKGQARLIVGVYVNDLIITGRHGIDKFKGEMMKLFKMSDLGLLSYYLGLEVRQTEVGISIRQAAYAAKLLERSGMADCNACAVPMEPRLKLSMTSESPLVDATEYRSIVGAGGGGGGGGALVLGEHAPEHRMCGGVRQSIPGGATRGSPSGGEASSPVCVWNN
ncbi:hypothetical protein C2845_PM01G10330 [Panicum miliaceum]|uniref:Integrase catalytic domain-containing protein n=1 Tax=Panicum miliaceum TaxID=4540 RepID=A0A3L6TJD2_PANMI|nr:hypothetical protein C2845_PM01G10330 [Panicum miliaceum]